MTVLVDTNIIVRNLKQDDPQHAAASAALRKHAQGNLPMFVAPQVCYEFWVVATRPPELNGLGLHPAEAREVLDDVRSNFVCLPDPPNLLDRWLHLCTRLDVRGKRAHDVRLIAWMHCHRIRDLLTFNDAHFASMPDIRIIVPSQ